MGKFWPRIFWSLALLPITGGGGYLVRRAFGAWGILDPIAAEVGGWLKMNVTASQAGWTLALAITLAMYAGALWLIWHRARPRGVPEINTVSKPAAEQKSDDRGLNSALYWIANRSADMRWMAAQELANNSRHVDEEWRITMACIAIQSAAEDGSLSIRGRRGHSLTWEDIAPDFWKSAVLKSRGGNPQWKLEIVPKSGLSQAAMRKIPKYAGLIVDWRKIEELWPSEDGETDADTKKLLARAPQIQSPTITNVTSNSQAGGITTHTVNFREPAHRQLKDGEAANILARMPQGIEVHIETSVGDTESRRFANQIQAFLKARGFSVRGAEVMGFGGGGVEVAEGVQIIFRDEVTVVRVRL